MLLYVLVSETITKYEGMSRPRAAEYMSSSTKTLAMMNLFCEDNELETKTKEPAQVHCVDIQMLE
jgi:hypothetical protein